MEKNIIVVDEQGNKYEATYPKRAKGLVKNGRARFVDEYTICLACPPNKKLEDSTMSENTIETVQNLQNEQIPNPLTIEYPLRKIDEIAKDQEYLMKAIAALKDNEDGQAVCRIVTARETTNQKLIAFYEKMYDDLSGRNEGSTKFIAREMIGIMKDPAYDEVEKDRAQDVLSSLI